MATANPTRSPPRKARERTASPFVDCGPPVLLAKPRPTRKTPPPRATPAYGVAPGALSFRHGLADHERAVIDAAFTILGCYLREPGGVFNKPEAVNEYLRLHLAGERRELFAVLFLDSQNRAIAIETLFIGTLTQTSVYPREVVLAALAHEANAVVLAHNHPGGSTAPSRADEALTQTLKAALALVDVRVFDHVIVAGDQTLSMAEKGLL